ncbi:MAG: hypothetical protein RI897_638 [Verrucomicrobiota bacterium]
MIIGIIERPVVNRDAFASECVPEMPHCGEEEDGPGFVGGYVRGFIANFCYQDDITHRINVPQRRAVGIQLVPQNHDEMANGS